MSIKRVDPWLNALIEAELKKRVPDASVGMSEALAELKDSIVAQIRQSDITKPGVVAQVVSALDRLTNKTHKGADRQPPGVAATVPIRSRRYRVETERRKAVDAYIDEVFSKTGKLITKKDIWSSARYETRSEFERWERCDAKATKSANDRFTRILREKPHLK